METNKRIEALERVITRIKKNDYDDVGYADEDCLVSLLRAKYKKQKMLEREYIVELVKDGSERKLLEKENEVIAKNNKNIEDFIESLEVEIKVLEIELMLYNGSYNIIEVLEDIDKRAERKNTVSTSMQIKNDLTQDEMQKKVV